MRQKEYIKKGYLYIEAITIALLAIIVFTVPLGNMDELWLYSYGSNIAKGLHVYKDINFCGTPLAIYILGAIFKVFGQELYIYRITTILIYTMVYLTCSNRVAKNTEGSIWVQALLSTYFLLMNQFILYEYNILNVLFLLMIIKLEEIEHPNNKTLLLIGAIVGLIVLTKQTTGAATILCCLIMAYIKKQSLKEIGLKVLGAAGVGIIFAGHLLITKNFNNMLEFCILGTGKFLDNFDIRLVTQLLATTGIYTMPMILYYVLKSYKTLKQEGFSKDTIACMYTLASLTIIIPIVDRTHLMIGLIPLLPMFFTDLYKKQPSLKASTVALLMLVPISIGVTSVVTNLPESLSTRNHYRYIPTTMVTEETLDSYKEWMESHRATGKEIYILDFSAVIYFMPEDIYHKYYDIMLNGNLGSETVEDLIKGICKEDNIVLIPDKDNMHYQAPKGMHEYLENYGMQVTDRINKYMVYTWKE